MVEVRYNVQNHDPRDSNSVSIVYIPTGPVPNERWSTRAPSGVRTGQGRSIMHCAVDTSPRIGARVSLVDSSGGQKKVIFVRLWITSSGYNE